MSLQAKRKIEEMSKNEHQPETKPKENDTLQRHTSRFIVFSQRELIETLEDVAGRSLPAGQN